MKNKYTDEPPKVFWKYYDLFRRDIITLLEFSSMSNLPPKSLLLYLDFLKSEKELHGEKQ